MKSNISGRKFPTARKVNGYFSVTNALYGAYEISSFRLLDPGYIIGKTHSARATVTLVTSLKTLTAIYIHFLLIFYPCRNFSLKMDCLED